MTDQHKDDISALITIVEVFREEQEKQRKDVDRAQLTATFACLYGKRISEHLGVQTRDIDEQVRDQDPKLARMLGIRGLTEPAPKHDPEAETDPFASP